MRTTGSRSGAGRVAVAIGLAFAASASAGCGGGGCKCGGDWGPYEPEDVPADLAPDLPTDVPADAPNDALPATPGGLPLSLPFAYVRPDVGTPLADAEVTAFTKTITGFWRRVDYFTWAAETGAGVDASTGLPDWLIWWQDFDAVKAGDTVTFQANAGGGSHNNAGPTGRVLTSALSGYLMSGDPAMRVLVEQYARSVTACMKGFVFDENDPVDWLIARNVTGPTQAFTLPSGRKKAVRYDAWHIDAAAWNADRFEYAHNPTWGDVWVTNKRSKDDMPYWFRMAAWLPYVIELAPDASVRAAATEAYGLLQKSARDIVDSGWQIRTKDATGTVFTPEGHDLASFASYIDLMPDAECDARLTIALLGYGDTRDVDCGSGQGSPYDDIAGSTNYFNYNIVTHFHELAILFALTTGHAQAARALLDGLVTRIARYRDPASGEAGQTQPYFARDIAVWLMRGAAVGLPLTSDEARLVQKFHVQSVTGYDAFPNWNLWSPSVADGTYNCDGGFRPPDPADGIAIDDVATLLEYCWSPFRNPAGARFIDCDVVRDPTRWGL